MKNIFYSSFLLGFIVLNLISCKEPEPETTGNILGTVTNKTTNEPIAGAIVTLTPGNTSTGTGSDGKFNFNDLEPKEYTIQIVKDGFKTNEKSIMVYIGKENYTDIQIEPYIAEINVRPNNIDFGTSETEKSVQVSNSGNGTTLAWSASTADSWITFSPNNGTIQGTNANPIKVTINRANLNPGTYNGTIVFNATGSNSANLQVTMTVPVPGAPTLTTKSAENITQTTASIEAQIISIGSNTISQYGHCWSTNSSPTISDAKSSFGSVSSPLNYSSVLSGLTANTTYHVRAYAVNQVGTSYSNEITFTTSNIPTAPSLSIEPATNINLNSAKIGGSILDLGTSNVTEHGHCWSTNPEPTVQNSKTTLGSANAPYNFSSSLSGLNGNTKYYVRAYATNSVGTSYSSEINFTTQSPVKPTVTTNRASNIAFTSFEITGTLTDLGNTKVTEHGHCWSTNNNPTIADQSTKLGEKLSTGTFLSTVTGLTVGTKYFVKAYATNEAGTSYSDVIEVQTNNYTEAVVTTGNVTNLTHASLTIAGNLTNTGNTAVTEHGHCWNTSSNPTVANNKTQLGSKNNTGTYESNLTGLEPNTTYYIRAFATNLAGTTYGNEQMITTTEAPKVYFVTSWGNDSNNGQSWESSLKSIQRALQLATPEYEIWVAEGLYNVSIDMKEGVNVYGGFQGNETILDQRNWESHQTAINGQLNQAQDFSTETKWDGFVIQNSTGRGVTLMIDGIIKNCTIKGHTNGGVYLNGGGLIDNCQILNCSLTSESECFGAGIKMTGQSSVLNTLISGNSIYNGRIGGGAGIYMTSGNVINCTISNNIDANYDKSEGAGVYVSSGTLINCLIINNTASYGGGNSYPNGGGLCWDGEDVTVINCTICKNTINSYAHDQNQPIPGGGGIYVKSGNLTLSNSIVFNNLSQRFTSNIDGSLYASYCAIEGGYEGSNNITLSNTNLPYLNSDYTLQSTSPCIDAGNKNYLIPYEVSTDLNGNERVKGSQVDIGAFEY